MNPRPHSSLSRRALLRAAGALVVMCGSPLRAASRVKPPLLPTELDSWIAIAGDGRVTGYLGKMDMGQGVDVAIAQLVAEELDVAVDQVTVVYGDTALTCDQGGASGSTGVQRGGAALRAAAAEARRQLLDLAADRLDVPAERLSISGGVVASNGNLPKRVSYADLVGGGYFESQIDWNGSYGNALSVGGKAPLKARGSYKVIGQSIPRRDVPGKVTGTAEFVTDIRLPNMLHGRMVRPPQAGTVPVAVDDRMLASLGARVIRRADFVGVVAETEWGAIRAAEALQVTWSKAPAPFLAQDTLYDHIRESPPVTRKLELDAGDVDAALSTAARVVTAEYEWPFQSHASIGPACAVADVRTDGVTVWTASQKPHAVRSGTARLLGRPVESVHVMGLPGPGSYGRNDAGDAAMDAAVLSAETGRPVRVQGMRHEGHGWDPKGPASIHRMRAGLDKDGAVIAYEVISKGFSRAEVMFSESDPAATLAGMLTGTPAKSEPAFGSPSESYAFPNKRLGWETIPPLLPGPSPLRTSHLRDPVGPQIHFASESFIDEIAAATGEDPIAFRLSYAKDPRHVAVLKAVADGSGWRSGPAGTRRKLEDGVAAGQGVAVAQRGGTIVAQVAEVDVDISAGRIWVRRVVVAHDCGLIVNPAALKLCIEGNVLQGISRACMEEVAFDERRVTSTDWNTYPILDIKDAPESVEVILLNQPDAEPAGAGEGAIRGVAAAIGNAVFEATGLRVRRAPITAGRLRALMQA